MNSIFSRLSIVPLALLAVALGSAARARAATEVLESEAVAPGLLYARYQKEKIIVHAMKMDLRQKDLHIRSIKAAGTETVRQMVDRLNRETRVAAAINGDFFRFESAAGLPYGVQVSDGKLLFAPLRRSMIGFGANNEPYIGVVSLKGKVSFAPKEKRGPDAKWSDIDGVNVLAEENSRLSGIYLYTPAFQRLKAGGTRTVIVVLESIRPALQVGDICEGKVAAIKTGEGELNVPEAGCLIYLFGDRAQKQVASLAPGHPVALKLDLPPIVGGVSQAIGGGPRLVRDGKVSVELTKEDFEPDMLAHLPLRHPRSAVGYDRKKENLFLVMVEGRHAESNGMTFGELGLFLTEIGCHQAMAFDGGGSSSLYAAGKGIVSYSVGAFAASEEREIANGLLITTDEGPRPEQAPRKK